MLGLQSPIWHQVYGRSPLTLYGPNDNYDLNNSHVLPALIRKMHEAKQRGDKEVVVGGQVRHGANFSTAMTWRKPASIFWNSRKKKLQSLFSDKQPPLVNVGCGEDLTIRELAELVKDVVGFAGNLTFDPSKPDGTMRKLLDVSKLNALGWKAHFHLNEGIAKAYVDYLGRNKENV